MATPQDDAGPGSDSWQRTFTPEAPEQKYAKAPECALPGAARAPDLGGVKRPLLAGLLFACATGLSADDAEATTPRVTLRLFDGTTNSLALFDTWIAGKGLNRDPDRVFTVVDQIDGAPALRVSGQGYGGLITKVAYRDYRLVTEFRWGLLTWGDRKENTRDNGFLLHCTGDPGNFSGTHPKPKESGFPDGFTGPWMKSVELQLIEGGVGDILVLGGYRRDGSVWPTTIQARFGKDRDGETFFDPKAELRPFPEFRLNWSKRDVDWDDKLGFRGKDDVESASDKWTRVEAIVRGGDFTYFVNGVKVNEATGCNLTSGRILIQTEQAEIYYRRVDLEPLPAN
jgi:hypothetical protein